MIRRTMTARPERQRGQRRGSRQQLTGNEHNGGKSPSNRAAPQQRRAAMFRVDSPIAGRQHAAGIMG